MNKFDSVREEIEKKMQNEANELSDLTVSIARLTEIVTVFRESNFVSESHNKGDLYKAKLVDWTDVDRGLAYDDFRYDVGKVLAITYQYQVNGAILISSDVFFLGFWPIVGFVTIETCFMGEDRGICWKMDSTKDVMASIYLSIKNTALIIEDKKKSAYEIHRKSNMTTHQITNDASKEKAFFLALLFLALTITMFMLFL